VVFVGNLWTNTRKEIVKDFLKNVGASSWYHSMMTVQSKGNKLELKDTVDCNIIAPIQPMRPDVYASIGEQWIGDFAEGYHLPHLFTNWPRKSEWDIINDKSFKFSKSFGVASPKNGIFIALSTEDVQLDLLRNTAYRNPPWLPSFCGTHTYGKNQIQSKSTYGNKRYIYAYLPTEGSDIAEECIPKKLVKSPNGDRGLDAMLNILAHELIETVSGYDIGNLCVYRFGKIKTDSKGANYTEQIGSRKYFIQQNFNSKTHECMNG